MNIFDETRSEKTFLGICSICNCYFQTRMAIKRIAKMVLEKMSK